MVEWVFVNLTDRPVTLSGRTVEPCGAVLAVYLEKEPFAVIPFEAHRVNSTRLTLLGDYEVPKVKAGSIVVILVDECVFVRPELGEWIDRLVPNAFCQRYFGLVKDDVLLLRGGY